MVRIIRVEGELASMPEQDMVRPPVVTSISRSGEHVALTFMPREAGYLVTLEPALRNFEIDRALDEALDLFDELQSAADRGVRGAQVREFTGDLSEPNARAYCDENELVILGQQVMQAWERPIMAEMAVIAARGGGRLLEVGFGMGISATLIQERGVCSHTIIDCNPDVLKKAELWRACYPGRDIRLVPGKWQDVIGRLGKFDAIFFDTYPANEAEVQQYAVEDAAYVQHFLPAAVEHLVNGGVMTYLTAEIDSLSRPHQRLLLKFFRSFELSVVRGLTPPSDCTYWWAESMAVVAAMR